MTTLETNIAFDYAQLIKREVLALETLIEHWGYVAGIAPDDVAPDILAKVKQALTELGWAYPEDDDSHPMSLYLNNVLDMTVLRADDRDVTRVEILRTCGGPRCDITRDSNDGTVVEISVHDGGLHSVVRVNVANITAGLDDLAGGY